MPVIFFLFLTWEGEAGSLEVWEGLGANGGAGYEVCGEAVRLELCRLVLADGNRNKTDACEKTLLETCTAAQFLLLRNS